MLYGHSNLSKQLKLPLMVIAACYVFFTSMAYAGVIHLPLKRTSANQPISKLEVVALVKSRMKGRILSVKRHAKYNFPDCHYVKLLEDDGEYQLIKVACSSRSSKKH